MANLPFDRTIINSRERPLSSDIDQAQSQLDRSLRDYIRHFFLRRAATAAGLNGFYGSPVSGFIGDGFAVRETSPLALSVNVRAGLGFAYAPGDVPLAIDGISGLDDVSDYKPIVLTADQTLTVPAGPPAGNSRIDIVEVRIDRRRNNSSTRDILNIGTGVFDPTPGVLKTLSFSLDGETAPAVVTPANNTAGIGYKQGLFVADPGPYPVPPTSPGYVKLAQILVGGGVASVDGSVINDLRFPLFVGDAGTVDSLWHFTNATGVVAPLKNMAPPGVRIGVNNFSVAGSLDVVGIIIAGALQGQLVVNTIPTHGFAPRASLMLSAGTGVVEIYQNVGITPGLIDAGDQTSLAVFGIKSAIGQPCIRFGVRKTAMIADALFSFGATIGVG